MIIGYARTSTLDQVAGLDAQVRDLTAAGAERIFSEQISSVAERPELELAIRVCRAGDVFMVTKIDRLARSVADLLRIRDRLAAEGVKLRVLAMPELDGAMGELVLSILGAIAQFERSLMLERQREGIDAAKRAGKYVGRQPTARRKVAEMRQLREAGVGAAEIARRLGVGRASVYRCLGETSEAREAAD